MEEEDVAAVATPQQFKALGHPMRHRLLFALGQGEATISQLAATLGSNKGNIAHHLKVLTDAGLAVPAGTRKVRGGTERYYRRAHRALQFHDAATTQVAFSAIAADLARPGGHGQAGVGEDLQVVGDVALVAAQGCGELADGRLALAEGEQQPVTHRMAQRLELLRRNDLGDVLLFHG